VLLISFGIVSPKLFLEMLMLICEYLCYLANWYGRAL